MENYSMKSEILRLRRIKTNLERQESALLKMLEVVDHQLLGLEVEDLQLASNLREELKEECDDIRSDNESDNKPVNEQFSNEDLNKTQLDLDSKLEEMLSGQFYVEEDEVEELNGLDDLLSK